MQELDYEMKASDPGISNAAPEPTGSGTDSKRCWVDLLVWLEIGVCGAAHCQGGYQMLLISLTLYSFP